MVYDAMMNTTPQTGTAEMAERAPIGYIHEVVWPDGINRSFHNKQPMTMADVEKRDGIKTHHVSERVWPVYDPNTNAQTVRFTEEHVRLQWQLAREKDCTIPDDALDDMRDRLLAALTQQQGGEQEALEYLAREYERRGFNASAANVRSRTYPGYQEAHDIAVHAITAALRSKQPAVSEGDGCAMCSRWKALAESADLLRSVAEKRAARLEAHNNTSKQAGEAVTWMCCEFHGAPPAGFDAWNLWAASPVLFGVTIRATTPPRHPAGKGMTSADVEADRELAVEYITREMEAWTGSEEIRAARDAVNRLADAALGNGNG